MKRSGTRYRFAAPLLALPLLAGCGRAPSAPPAPPPPEVVVATLQPEKVALTTELPGRVASIRVAEIRPQVSGPIRKRLFTEGADVKEGEVLFEIEPAPFQAAHDYATATLSAAKKAADRARAALPASIAGVARQEAVLALARINRQRLEDLFKDRAVSASERDQAATDVDVAEATLRAVQAQVESDRASVASAEAAIQQAEAATQTTRIQLEYTRVRAPIAGRIGRALVTEGAMATAYQAVLAVVQSLDPIYVDVPQSTAELMRLRSSLEGARAALPGTDPAKVRLLLEDGTAYPRAGTLQFRDVSVDPSTGSVILRIVVPNPDGTLLPGLFVRAIVEEGVREQALRVPQQAVSRDLRGNPQALIVDDAGTVRVRSLTTDRAQGSSWLVTSGLSAGDRVIVEGQQRVRPGSAVKIVPADGGPKPDAPPAPKPH